MNSCFPKAERLCSRRLIDRLYAEGHRLMAFPYSVQWLEEPALDGPCQVLIVAPKRKFKHAVDRNRVKRLTRECWRQRKEPLLAMLRERSMHITLSLVYIHNEIMSYDQLQLKFEKLMLLLEKELTV